MTEIDKILAQTEGHTPGPWDATPLEYDNCWMIETDDTQSIKASVENAALIAAAPALRAEVVRLRDKTNMLEELLAFYEHAADHLDNQFPVQWEEAVQVGLRVVPSAADKIVNGKPSQIGTDFVPIERLHNAEQEVVRLLAERAETNAAITKLEAKVNELLELAGIEL